ncbi:MAG TPA: hypothetical protein VJC39_04610 [Candidatus Nanoarchaeia archaeon]|nr:hypothetical protein [Candidatus Nanoarchaeia archaeon]
MSDVSIPPIILRYTGPFDYELVYSSLVSWAKNYGYFWYETGYKHKVPSPSGAEQEYSWKAEKNVTEYVKYEVKIELHTWDTREMEVLVNGKKKMMADGRLEFTINGKAYLDWQKKFGQGKFSQWLGKIYQKMYSKNIEGVYVDTLYYRIWDLQAMLKKLLDLQTKKHAYKGYLKES